MSRADTARGTRLRETHVRALTKSGNILGTVARTFYRGVKHIGAPYDSRHDSELQQEVFRTAYQKRVKAGGSKIVLTTECKCF